ncbi:hypothetical protein CERSUDRAFT_72166 [Gelatoporia subvermispora B]|uniref:Uncharacterized protein n=1 Tax=Ceriporiopsis subvermispora (strain B) TaxID=914234 RepID=M2RKA5_CERS8|nr:hypothetical protein CERSUDRAFT_72166 [Gelatoporia subvermispora B]
MVYNDQCTINTCYKSFMSECLTCKLQQLRSGANTTPVTEDCTSRATATFSDTVGLKSRRKNVPTKKVLNTLWEGVHVWWAKFILPNLGLLCIWHNEVPQDLIYSQSPSWNITSLSSELHLDLRLNTCMGQNGTEHILWDRQGLPCKESLIPAPAFSREMHDPEEKKEGREDREEDRKEDGEENEENENEENNDDNGEDKDEELIAPKQTRDHKLKTDKKSHQQCKGKNDTSKNESDAFKPRRI